MKDTPASSPVPHPAPSRQRIGVPRAFIDMLGAPAAWAVQMMLSEALASYSCYPHQAPLQEPLLQNIIPVLTAISLVCLIAGALFLFGAWRSWNKTRHEASGEAVETGEGRTRFMAVTGVIASAIFFAAILFTALSFLLVSPCHPW